MTQEQSGVEHFFRTDDDATHGGATAGTPRLDEAAGLGASLRALREAHRWSQADVSARLKFGVRQIEALEAERWDELPQGPSLRGLVRNYARLLDVDPDAMLKALPAHLQHRPAHAPGLTAVGGELPHSSLRHRDGNVQRRPVWPKVVFAFIFVCLAALAAYLVFEWWLPRNAADDAEANGLTLPLSMQSVERLLPGGGVTVEELPAAEVAGLPPEASAPVAEGRIANAEDAVAEAPVVQETPAAPPSPVVTGEVATVVAGVAASADVAPAPGMPGAPTPAMTPSTPIPAAAPPSQPPADPAAPAPTAMLGNVLGFEVRAASWVEVRDASGSVVLSSTLQPGSSEQLDVATPARVVIGNAGGVTLTWRGSPVDLAAHQRGNVARLTLE